ncbi:MAG: hypothetical protein JWL73_1252 [Actinomycetia bacterium]|nr:hypothetical protein [Actinomycetes bacterium]
MDTVAFTAALEAMSASDLDRVAVGLERLTAFQGDEVDAWRATMAIDRALRRTDRTRRAAQAAQRAARAVLEAATRAGVNLPDAPTTCVARAAAELARGFVVADLVERELSFLLMAWEPVLFESAARSPMMRSQKADGLR